MRSISGLSGPVAVDRLGSTLVGEYLQVALYGYDYWMPNGASRTSEDPEAALKRLRKEASIQTVIDITTIDMGRDPQILRQASKGSGVAVVCATGLTARGGNLPAAFAALSAEDLAEIFEREILHSLPGLECRAGVIVLGPEHPHDDLADKLVLAASFAHAETEAPVIALGGGEFGCWQARRLLARGADPERVVVAGLGGAEISFAELDEVAATGVHLGFTNIGQGSILDREPRAALLAYAIRRYGVRRICLGTGSCSSWYGGPQAPPKTWGADALLDIRRRLLSYGIDASEVAEILKVDEWLFQGDESERS